MASPNPQLRSRAQTQHQSEDDRILSPSGKASKAKSHVEDLDDGPTRFSLLDILRVLAGILLLSTTLSYFVTGNSIFWNYRPPYTRPARIKAWLVSFPFFHIRRTSSCSLTQPFHTARPLTPYRRPTIPLQWHRPHPPHPPRRQRYHLRRQRQPPLLRPRR